MSFYGDNSPYLDGLKVVTTRNTWSAGTVDKEGQQRRTKYFPSDDGNGNFGFEFFGFDTTETYTTDANGVSTSTIDQLKIAMYDPTEFEKNRATVDSYDSDYAEIADDEEAAELGLEEIERLLLVDNVIINSQMQWRPTAPTNVTVYRFPDQLRDQAVIDAEKVRISEHKKWVEEQEGLVENQEAHLNDTETEDKGATAACVIGAIVFILMVVLLIFKTELCKCCCKKGRNSSDKRVLVQN